MSEEYIRRLENELVRLREVMQSAVSGVKVIEERLDNYINSNEKLIAAMEKARDKRCEMHEKDIEAAKEREVERDKKIESLEGQKKYYNGIFAVVGFLIGAAAPFIIGALIK
jgi:uncharacterized membrane protein